jgi:hypothetical protein
MEETLIRGVLERVGERPLERLMWAVDFAQRSLLTPGDKSNAVLELTCFIWASHLPKKDVESQISAILRDNIPSMVYGQPEVSLAQDRFKRVLMAAAGEREVEMPLKHVKAHFTRNEGLSFVSGIRDGLSTSAKERTEAKLEAAIVKLLRLLDTNVRTSVAKEKGGERFMPLRMYVGICPEAVDGCGKLFAKTRMDQNYCSRTCASRAQVRRFRAKNRLKKATR